ncbi:MAG: hypothetical protein K2X77_29245 [Candidatus Obscuribacterales bacterium]|jgi:uncharacterized membrane protein YvlD (DUF360 family)|nr:hypothetical protein [Candidatus Obscuribacterales bacterium]
MISFLLRSVIIAAIFCFVFPQFAPGVVFHGAFWPEGILWAAVFSVVCNLVVLGLLAGGAALALATGGLALILEVVVFLLGFWLIPALQLQTMAHFFPAQFTVDSWGSAIWASLVMAVAYWVIDRLGKEFTRRRAVQD